MIRITTIDFILGGGHDSRSASEASHSSSEDGTASADPAKPPLLASMDIAYKRFAEAHPEIIYDPSRQADIADRGAAEWFLEWMRAVRPEAATARKSLQMIALCHSTISAPVLHSPVARIKHELGARSAIPFAVGQAQTLAPFFAIGLLCAWARAQVTLAPNAEALLVAVEKRRPPLLTRFSRKCVIHDAIAMAELRTGPGAGLPLLKVETEAPLLETVEEGFERILDGGNEQLALGIASTLVRAVDSELGSRVRVLAAGPQIPSGLANQINVALDRMTNGRIANRLTSRDFCGAVDPLVALSCANIGNKENLPLLLWSVDQRLALGWAIFTNRGILLSGERLYLLSLMCNFAFSYEAAIAEYGMANIAANLESDPATASGILFWNFFACAAGAAVSPYLASRMDSLRAVCVCVFAAAIAIVLGCNAHIASHLILVRMVIGFLSTNATVFLGIVIAQRSAPHDRTAVFGGTSLGIGLGYLCAPIAMAASVFLAGNWRLAYGSVAIAFLFVPWLTRMLPPAEPADEPSSEGISRWDLLNMSSLGVLMLSGALMLHPASPLRQHLAWLAVVAAVAGIFMVWTGNRSSNPVLDLRLLRYAKAEPLLFATLLSFCGAFLVAFVAPYLAIYRVHAGAVIGILLLGAFPIGFATGGALASSLLREWPAGRLAMWSYVAAAAVATTGAGVVQMNSAIALALIFFLAGTLRGISIAPMATLATLQVPVYRLPEFLCAVTIFRSVGMLIGVGAAALAWRHFGLDLALPLIAEGNPQENMLARYASCVYIATAIIFASTAFFLRQYASHR
jgi:hypothetical protein